MTALPSADYRVQILDGLVQGSICTRCQRSSAPATPRCPACGAAVSLAGFRPAGTVWSSTVVHVAVGEHPVPSPLAYVDLEEGPRVLVRWSGEVAPRIGQQVRLTGSLGEEVRGCE